MHDELTGKFRLKISLLENFFLRAEGGVIKRAGLSKLFEFDTSIDTSKVQQHRLLPFIFSDDERYIISLEPI